MNEFEQDGILSSWKEIATFLGKGVRTVQRWETQGMPVHRPKGESVNVVLGLESELRAWMQLRCENQEPVEDITEMVERLRTIQAQNRQIAHKLEQLENRLKKVLLVRDVAQHSGPGVLVRVRQTIGDGSDLQRAG